MVNFSGKKTVRSITEKILVPPSNKEEPKSLNNAIEENKILLLELDVKGAMELKQSYPENSYSIFIIPPSIDHLRARLKKRGTDSDERIEVRLQRFEEEMNLKENFDQIMINEDLESAKLQLTNIINKVKEGD